MEQSGDECDVQELEGMAFGGPPENGIATEEPRSRARMDWSRVKRTTYLLHQYFSYTYPVPIADLRHRLVILPPPVHGDQRLVAHHVGVSGALAHIGERLDNFGNQVIEVTAPLVERAIDFEARIVVERTSDAGLALLPAAAAADRRLLEPTKLTEPDAALRAVARSLGGRYSQPLELAHQISRWVHGELHYAYGVTGIETTAAQALALGCGVCQDHAHVMIALCRLNGLPARYVSGHLLGEGGTHAWLEVLVPDPDHPGYVTALPFDPTQSARPGLNYVTVAVGRDYSDVAPTSGTYRSGHGGQLSTSKRLGLTAVEYAAA